MKLKGFSIRRFLLTLLLLLAFVSPTPVKAQSTGLYYVVKEGDSLTSIAHAFRTSTNRLMNANYLSEGDTLYLGRRLKIPGFDDVQGEAVKVTVPYGESLDSFNKQLRIPDELMVRLNFITNPDGFFAGQTYFTIYTDIVAQERVPLHSGMTNLELAVTRGVSEWTATEFNHLKGNWDLIPNDTLFFPAGEFIAQDPSLTVSPSPLPQGKTIQIVAQTTPGTEITGRLGDYTLHFFPEDDFNSVALQGIHRMAPPGLMPLVIKTTYPDGTSFSFQQNVFVRNTDYGFDAELLVADNFVDPEVTDPENAWLFDLVAPAPSEKLWSGKFVSPSPSGDKYTSTFGRLRSYNGSPYEYFHTGQDYPGGESTPIFAAAAGIVVFAGEKTVRGNATVISHGRGVYTGYWHQSRIDVKVGDHVDAGQQIGMVGATGRVTGLHLHFEVLVGGVQVDPVEWLAGKY